ncbi:cutinase family protein, partial [Mycobacterium sp. E3198]|uniref:cutinase family protein n=2 Tax=Mycobacterium sp. E3198 TaxID=1834143 RepID=UPI001E2873EF
MRLVAMTPGAHRVLDLAAATWLAVALVVAPAVTPSPIAGTIPAASAACPDAEVVFARGREEPPGVGAVGDAFVNALRGKTRKSIGVYGVNYPANITTGSGANDIGAHVESMARTCPNTRIVLGGYSLGAEVVDRAMWGGLPPGMD